MAAFLLTLVIDPIITTLETAADPTLSTSPDLSSSGSSFRWWWR
ncbi:MAG: hypothetical protein ACLPZR_13605 [Solirubrobacteraceae bacterium]